ncbi:MAG: DNA primase [Parvibaculum sp.]|uniref:DNA primase n=1 Tax=Parvibaculum sp. TaxID=2024848 RepID=UPI003C735EBA
MSFPKSFLDELKARIRVSEVVGRKVKLIRRGREFVGLSPFTNEKNPSFTVNDEKQFWHCFSSGEHGDVIKFLEKVENLSFLEAVERLAGEAGMEMPQRDPRNIEREREAASLVDVMEMAAEFFRQKLQSGAGAEARAYLERRGIRRDTIERFGLGYSPGSDRSDRTQLLKHLKLKGVSIEQMAEAGLIISGPDVSEPFDRFRNRLMFPIADARGRTIAFGGRALDSEQKAKYLNSPETPLFHKGRGLYNLHQARKPAYDAGTVIAVEGYMDVIGLAQGGIDNAVAPLGTALTEDQIGLMWRMAPEPILCFDGDKAGLRAAFRAVERVLPLLKPGHSLRFALLPNGKDPDDLVREEGGDAMRDVLAQARPLAEMVWEKEVSAGTWDTPERRAALEARIEEVIGEIADTKVKAHYAQELRGRISRLFGPKQGRGNFRQGGGAGNFRDRPWKPGQRFMRDPRLMPVTPELRRSALARNEGGAAQQMEGLMVLVMLNHPELLHAYCEEFSRLEIRAAGLDRLRNEIIDIAALNAPLEREALMNHLVSRDLADIAQRLEDGAALKGDRFALAGASHEEAEKGFLDVLTRHRRTITLEAELRAAERALAEEMNEENWARLQAIHAQMQIERPDLSEGLMDSPEPGWVAGS